MSHVALGLFAVVPWDGWAKSNDLILERCYLDEPNTFRIHPDHGEHRWPKMLEDAYTVWPQALLPDTNEVFRRITFMFGRPFLKQLVPAHVTERDELLRQFGGIPLAPFIQLSQWVRRGFVAKYDTYAPPTGAISKKQGASCKDTNRYLNIDNFAGLDIVLVTGEHNMLWHSDSIHLMYDWLRRGKCRNLSKQVLQGYAHQDMYWGRDAHVDVFPMLVDALATGKVEP